MSYEAGPTARKYPLNTESPFEKIVKWLSVYIIGLLALFLLAKEHILDDVMICQPINRAIKEHLSYSQTQAIYDRAFCSANMTDFSDNLIRADTEALNRIPGVTVLGIKGKPKIMYQRYFPIALAIQALVSYLPALLWILWSTEDLTIAIRYIAETCKDLVNKDYSGHPMHSTPKPFSRSSVMAKELRLGELDSQINHWLEQKFLTRFYIAKLVLTELVFIFFLLCYLQGQSIYVSNFQSQFVCRVDGQSLVSCALPIVRIYIIVWYTNILVLDVCILLTTFQFMNILCCIIRKRNFFFLTYVGIDSDSQVKTITDAHLISYFCHQNLNLMPPDIVVCKATMTKTSRTANSSTLISFGETESLSDEMSTYYTATNSPITTK